MATLATVGLLGLLAAGAGDEGKKKPPFADGPEKEEAPKPAVRNWTVNEKGFSFTFSFAPGIPDPKQMSEILILANKIPKTPHPRYGSRVPLKNARITLELTNPAGELVGTYLAHAMPLSRGKYGLHFTPTQEGIYKVSLSGRTQSGEELAAKLDFPVAVWPLPKELQGSGDDAGGQTVRRVIRKPLGK